MLSKTRINREGEKKKQEATLNLSLSTQRDKNRARHVVHSIRTVYFVNYQPKARKSIIPAALTCIATCKINRSSDALDFIPPNPVRGTPG